MNCQPTMTVIRAGTSIDILVGNDRTEQWFHVAVFSLPGKSAPASGKLTIGGTFQGPMEIVCTPLADKGLITIPFDNVIPVPFNFTTSYVASVSTFLGQTVGGKLGFTSTFNVDVQVYIVSTPRILTEVSP